MDFEKEISVVETEKHKPNKVLRNFGLFFLALVIGVLTTIIINI